MLETHESHCVGLFILLKLHFNNCLKPTAKVNVQSMNHKQDDERLFNE